MQIEKDALDFENLNNKEIGFFSIVPSFIEEKEDVITGAKKGTLIHLFMQKLDFTKDYNFEMLENLKQSLVLKNMITEEESKSINLKKVENFLNSSLAKKIKASKQIEKEKAFCMKINAKDIWDEAKDEEILVQGIIDLYCISENDEIILVDYKTDFVENEKELILKYKKQLDLYRKALEEGLGKKVKEIYIYSLYLNKEILL